MSEEASTLEYVFLGKARAAFDNLFERTRIKDELNFVLSLSGGFKAYTYTSAMESQHAFRDYDEFMSLDQFRGRPIRLRVAFSYYLYTAESAGLWCIPMAVKHHLSPYKAVSYLSGRRIFCDDGVIVTVHVMPDARCTSSGTSSNAMRTGTRCARRTQVKTGLTSARRFGLSGLSRSAIPLAMLSTCPFKSMRLDSKRTTARSPTFTAGILVSSK
jgi:hypothetical protein